MNIIHLEKEFEADIVNYLVSHGWVEGTSPLYDKETALYTEDALLWAQTAHSDAWAKLVSQHGGKASAVFISRMVSELENLGTLSVLRHGFKIVGAGGTYFSMLQGKPRSSRNPEATALYDKNILRVVRQVYYSQNNKNSIDLVLFVNGIPVATIEIKTESTQSVYAAMKQYRQDRFPKDKATNRNELLLQFKSRCVVHFALSTEEVYMTTKLAGDSTYFLPFNKGDNEGKGNPVNPQGPRTAYLWEDIFERDEWIHILCDFVHLDKSEKIRSDGRKQIVEKMIFPRYHQWDAVNRLVETSQIEKEGNHYLIQHSAGSGKSNSIAWLAHHLSGLHDAEDNTIFDAVIVITDRRVLDSQLRDTIYQFQKTMGVVEGITSEDGSKSSHLRDALLSGKRIIVVTIQTFKPLLGKIGTDEDLKKKRFAVIADEAHTSQTGGAAGALKLSLSNVPIEEGEDITNAEVLAELASRYRPTNVSFYAFTATPKSKTLELFGRADEDGVKRPFHTYSMKQAIEEKFILDPLQNYISYKVAYKLTKDGEETDSDDVEKNKACKVLNRWVRLHAYNISQKVQVIVEHFREHVAWRLDGEAKAMVVTSSREEVIRYKLAIDEYIKDNKYKIGTIVAFSGDIEVKELTDEKFTERNMNPALHGTDIPEAFDTTDYQILLVANKFQTGFDQPKLVAMYVDKKLSGVATVQTLSRLNRIYPGKDWTVVLDFVNEPDDILADFQKYYKSASLPEGTDPNLIYALETKLDAKGIYLESEVEAFAQFYWNLQRANRTHFQLQKHLQPPAQRFKTQYRDALARDDKEAKDALELFVKDLGSFTKLFEFITQIFDFGDDVGLEKRYVYYKELTPILYGVLRDDRDVEKIDLSDVRLSHYAVRATGKEIGALDPEAAAEFEAAYGEIGSGSSHDPERVKLFELIEQLNLIFEGELSDTDLVNYAYTVTDKLMENETLRTQAQNNTKKQFSESDDFMDAVLSAVEDQNLVNSSLAQQIMSDSKKRDAFLRAILDLAYRKFTEVERERVG